MVKWDGQEDIIQPIHRINLSRKRTASVSKANNF